MARRRSPMPEEGLSDAQERLADLIAEDPDTEQLVGDVLAMAEEYQERGLTVKDLAGALRCMGDPQ